MKKYFYSCDTGSIAVSCGGSIIKFNNGYGDGCFKVYEGSEKDFEEYKKEHYQYPFMEDKNYRFVTSSYFFKAYVLNYDCLEPNNITTENCLFELNGKYDIYYLDGKIYFVKLEN